MNLRKRHMSRHHNLLKKHDKIFKKRMVLETKFGLERRFRERKITLQRLSFRQLLLIKCTKLN